MALINCPECGKQISDKATACPNCGYPIQNGTNNHNENVNIILKSAYNNKLNVIKAIRLLYDFTLSESNEIVRNMPCVLSKNVAYDDAIKIKTTLENAGAEIAIEPCVEGQDVNIKRYKSNEIRCPRCGSTAITTGQRGVSLLWGFLGSNKTTNRCGKCGYMWQPK